LYSTAAWRHFLPGGRLGLGHVGERRSTKKMRDVKATLGNQPLDVIEAEVLRRQR
jgi:hypothetical protein